MKNIKNYDGFINESHQEPEDALAAALRRNGIKTGKISYRSKEDDGMVQIDEFTHVQVGFGPAYCVVSEHPEGLKFGKDRNTASAFPMLVDDIKKSLQDETRGKFQSNRK